MGKAVPILRFPQALAKSGIPESRRAPPPCPAAESHGVAACIEPGFWKALLAEQGFLDFAQDRAHPCPTIEDPYALPAPSRLLSFAITWNASAM